MKELQNIDFGRSIRQQIAINQARTPTERFQALCDLLDAMRAMAPMDPEAIERRRRAMVIKEREREKFRAQLREWIAAGRSHDAAGI